MSYLVLARKYRPTCFEDVIDQKHVTATLQNAVANNRLANAYLFAGPRGVGKTTIARILAKAINCEKGPTKKPCNECSFCKEISEARSLDVLEIDGASNRGIDEVRNLRESLRYAPTPGKYKIYIIDEVHMLTTEAFNALLKTLEEPPKNVLFMFATTEPHRVPPTILSRCQRFDFKRIPARAIVEHLQTICNKEQISISDEGLRLIAQKADGSMRDSQSVLDQLIAYSGEKIETEQIADVLGIIDQELYFECSEMIKGNDTNAALRMAEKVFAEGFDFREFMLGLAEHFRNMMIVKSTSKTELLDVTENLAERYMTESEFFEIEDLIRLVNIASQESYSIHRSENPRLQLELALVKIATMDKTVTFSEILDSFEELKKKQIHNDVTSTANGAPKSLNDIKYTSMSRSSKPFDPQQNLTRDNDEKTLNIAVGLDCIKDKWPDIITQVKHKKIALGFLLDEGVPTKIDAKALEVMFRKGDGFHMSSVERGRPIIEQVIANVVGMRLRVRCALDEEGVLGDESPNSPRNERRTAFEQLISSNPVARNIVGMFDAELLD